MKTGSSSVDSLISKLKRRTVVGSFHCAKETLLVLRNIASQSKWSNVQELLDKIKMYGAKLSNAQPIELAVGNMVRRVLHMIREEYITYVLEDPSIPAEKKPLQQTATASMIDLLGDSNSTRVDMNLVPVSVMKPLVIQEINQFIDELDSLYMNIASQALDHIHDNEVIMTLGKSKTVEEFLKAAHRKRKFQVLVAAGGPTSQGRDLVSSLARSGIDAKFIPDSDIFAYMSRVNKVILSTHAVLANGGLIASTGSHLIALSAKYHHVPLIVTAGLYKLSPLQPSDEDKFNLLDNPDVILPYHHELTKRVDILNPFFDYIAPEYVSLYVTNLGGHPPSYVYRLLGENYHTEDYRLDETENETPLSPNVSRVESSSSLEEVAAAE